MRKEQTIILGSKGLTMVNVAPEHKHFENRGEAKRFLRQNNIYSPYLSD